MLFFPLGKGATHMRVWLSGPRMMGLRPGISMNVNELAGSASKSSSVEKPTGCFVYVLHNVAKNLVRVGTTDNPFTERAMFESATSDQLDLSYIAAVPGDGGQKILKNFRKVTEGAKKVGGWLQIDVATAESAVIGASIGASIPILQTSTDQVREILDEVARVQRGGRTTDRNPLNTFLYMILAFGVIIWMVHAIN